AASSTNLLTDVQWRGRHYRGHRHGWGGRRHYRGGYWGPGPGAAFGLAAGAMIGSAIAAQNAPVYAAPGYDAAIQSCINRFRSYDVRTQTYLGYDGLRHSCP
ncbi:MAG: BA14K family protein, partial [Rhizobiales bacterium]|nr:BA14K family protein [Hyphomicrobiales bacterium]